MVFPSKAASQSSSGHRGSILLAAAVMVVGLGAAPAARAAGSQQDVCRGAGPVHTRALHGPVLHVPDGSTLCVARGFEPSLWFPLHIADAPAATTRATLMAAAFGKDVDCTIAADGAATCMVEGRSVGQLASEPLTIKAGRSWREAVSADAGLDR